MAKKKRTGETPSWSRKLHGCKFAFTGKMEIMYKATAVECLKVYGGKHVEKLDRSVAYLVTGNPGNAVTAAKKRAAKLNDAGAAIQIIDEAGFHQLLIPTTAEALEMLSSQRGRKAWRRLRTQVDGFFVDFDGWDFRGAELSGCWLRDCSLDGADFRNAELVDAALPEMCEAKFDNADLRETSSQGWTDCSLKRVDMTDGAFYFYGAYYEGNDFTGAKLVRVRSDGTQLSSCIFKNADLTSADLPRIEARKCDFTGAKLIDGGFRESDFSKSVFVRAKLNNGDFNRSSFRGADLRNADLRGALLEMADFTGAKLDGANFADALLQGAKIPNAAIKKAKGLVVPKMKLTGPQAKKLLQAAGKADLLVTSAKLSTTHGPVELRFRVEAKTYGDFLTKCSIGNESRQFFDNTGYSNPRTPLANIWTLGVSRFDGQLDLDSITSQSKKCPVKGKQLQELAKAAWCEAFEVELPSPEEHQALKKAKSASKREVRAEMLEELRGAAGGVKKWNRRTAKEFQAAGDFRRSDCNSLDLVSVKFKGVDFQASKFENAILNKATFQKGCDFRKANFVGADLREAILRGVVLEQADFRLADLRKAILTGCSLKGCSFADANMTNVDLSKSDLRGADFSSAKLSGKFSGASYDEKTKFPNKFGKTSEMKWQGHGLPPDQRTKRSKSKMDFSLFMERLAQSVDAARLKNALKMLQANAFELYSESDSDHLAGIVKSQTDSSLVYSCHLDSAGSFSCCTQNLNACGGLRGALCKHLLVLIIGLAKQGKMDLQLVDAWAESSQQNKPTLDKDQMASLLLKYKGAEAGDVDWRPTETVPEDFYSM